MFNSSHLKKMMGMEDKPITKNFRGFCCETFRVWAFCGFFCSPKTLSKSELVQYLDLLVLPNGGLMLIYHGRIRNKNHQLNKSK